MSEKRRATATFGATNFSIVLGLSGLGQTWLVADEIWSGSRIIGEILLAATAAVWLWLLIGYGVRALRSPWAVKEEFEHPVQGAAPALIGIATLVLVPAAKLVSPWAAYALLAFGLSWHLVFALWHTGDSWKAGRDQSELAPTIYLPTVAGNFCSGAALAVVGLTDFGWLFFGAGFFSWLVLESLVLQRLWHPEGLPIDQRATIGIHLAPPAVAASAWLSIGPGSVDHWILMLWGYGLFQVMLGLRLMAWLHAQPFSRSFWSYTFGASSVALVGMKLELSGNRAAALIAPVIFAIVNLFEGYLLARTVIDLIRRAIEALRERPYVLSLGVVFSIFAG